MTEKSLPTTIGGRKGMPYLTWNVIGNEEFNDRSKRVFSSVANVLSHTLGPFGATSIIETSHEYKVTKDGWNVLKSLHFNSPTEENILMLLSNIAQQVVRKVGDGSTSSVVAAHKLLEEMSTIFEGTNIRSKTLLDTLTKVSNRLVAVIEQVSTQVDREGDFQEIYNLAYVSTNENAEIASLIQQAYQATRIPSIQYEKSRTANNELEIIDGYQSKLSYYDRIFVNTDNETGVYDNVNIVMFDHTIDKEYHFEFILELIMESRKKEGRLLILAPFFDTAMGETFATICNQEKSQTGTHYLLIGRAHLLKNHDQNMYKDLSALLGAKVVTENVINEYNKKRLDREEREKTYDPRLSGEHNEYINVDPLHYQGHVGKVTLGKRFSLFQEFDSTDVELLKQYELDAANKLAAQEAIDEELNSVNHDIFSLIERVNKLQCKTAVIKAGGATSLEKGANYDLLEDAVKATSSAYKHGYNLGGNLAIVKAAELLSAEDELEARILVGIRDAFKSVFQTVLSNGQLEFNYDTILGKAIEDNVCLNIVNGEYDGTVINPTKTDVEILKGTISIVSLMLSSNQYISLTPNLEVK